MSGCIILVVLLLLLLWDLGLSGAGRWMDGNMGLCVYGSHAWRCFAGKFIVLFTVFDIYISWLHRLDCESEVNVFSVGYL